MAAPTWRSHAEQANQIHSTSRLTANTMNRHHLAAVVFISKTTQETIT